jgi:hypothetical protein
VLADDKIVLTDAVAGDQLSFFDMAERIKEVLHAEVTLQEASTLQEVHESIGTGDSQNPLALVSLDA